MLELLKKFLDEKYLSVLVSFRGDQAKKEWQKTGERRRILIGLVRL